MWGKNPSNELKLKISKKKATWIEMEFKSAAYTWKTVFKYPLFLLRPLGALMLISVVLLNISPPPYKIGNCCCAFYSLVLGGGIFTWFVNYQSSKHSIPLFVALFLVIILTSDNQKIPDSNSTGNSFITSISITFVPILIGFLCGPGFLKLGLYEDQKSH